MSHTEYIKALKIYYWLTPVFMLLDYGFDLGIRVAMPAEFQTWAVWYYVICFLAAFWFRTMIVAATFALIESAINICLLILSVYLPLISISKNIEHGAGFQFGGVEIFHFIIVGSVLLFSFHNNPLIKNRNFDQNN